MTTRDQWTWNRCGNGHYVWMMGGYEIRRLPRRLGWSLARVGCEPTRTETPMGTFGTAAQAKVAAFVDFESWAGVRR